MTEELWALASSSIDSTMKRRGRDLQWRGSPILKNPCDLWMMLEILQSVRPAVLIETGTHHGGSAMYFSEMMTLLGSPVRIVTVDINPKWQVEPHPLVSIPSSVSHRSSGSSTGERGRRPGVVSSTWPRDGNARFRPLGGKRHARIAALFRVRHPELLPCG